jgi:tetratricopeptide (TPR) repeat protein
MDIAELCGDPDRLTQACQALLHLEPTAIDARMRPIDLHRKLLDPKPGTDLAFAAQMDRYRQITLERPNDAGAHFDLGYALLTLTANFNVSGEDLKEAATVFRKISQLDSTNPLGYWGLRRLYSKMSLAGESLYEEAIAACRTVVATHPGLARAHHELANAFHENYQENLKHEALAEYLLAVTIDPALIAAHFKIASIYRILNRYDEALCAYRTVIVLDPTSSWSKDARRSSAAIAKARAEQFE